MGKLKMKKTIIGWSILCAGALLISFAANLVWGIATGICIAGVLTIVYGVAILSTDA